MYEGIIYSQSALDIESRGREAQPLMDFFTDIPVDEPSNLDSYTKATRVLFGQNQDPFVHYYCREFDEMWASPFSWNHYKDEPPHIKVRDLNLIHYDRRVGDEFNAFSPAFRNLGTWPCLSLSSGIATWVTSIPWRGKFLLTPVVSGINQDGEIFFSGDATMDIPTAIIARPLIGMANIPQLVPLKGERPSTQEIEDYVNAYYTDIGVKEMESGY